jgi:eukaryotic-like serine/threonine-protein kinase
MPALSEPGKQAPSDRYTIYGEVASGGMATIQYGRLVGPGGFSRAVAIKRLHRQFSKDESFVAMFLDEARLSARISHANVVQTLDILSDPDELSVVMEYVHGESLSSLFERLTPRAERVPVRIAVTLVVGVLHGLHAAHETRGELGEPLHIIHRDVSPQNILVGVDGVARLVDFGIARAQGRSRATPAGQLKGKLAYMACEQYRGEEVDRRVDVYGASVVLWEALAGRLLFTGDSDAAVVSAVLNERVPPPSELAPDVPPELDRIVLKGLSRDPNERYASAREMALALEQEVGVGSQSIVSDWLEQVAGDVLRQRAEALREMRVAREESRGPEATTRPFEVARAKTPAEERPLDTPFGKSGWRAKKVSPRRIAVGLLLALAIAGTGAWVALRSSDAPRQAAVPPNDRPAESAPLPARLAGDSKAAPTQPSLTDAPPPVPVLPLPASEPAKKELASPVASDAVEAERDGSMTLPARHRGEGGERSKARRREAKPAATKTSEAAEVARPEELPARPKSSAKEDCREPFTIDALGIRRVRPECLD